MASIMVQRLSKAPAPGPVIGRAGDLVENRGVRIAIVCPYAWDRPGGVQSHVRALAPALRERGHVVSVIAPHSGEATYEDGVTLAGRAIGVPANGSIAPISPSPSSVSVVKKALANFRPDVVHLHEPLIPSISLGALLSFGGPFVGTFHASSDASIGYRIARPVLKRAAARLAVRTAVSDAARTLIARYFPGEYYLTPNGINTQLFSSADPIDLGPGRTVLFLSRIERRKGLEVLIQAMTRIRELDATLVVAGDGPAARRCRQLADDLQIKSSWLGRVHEERKPSILRSADVLCAPGLGGESFGIVLIEAMAAGVPVICSDIQGFRSVAAGSAEMVPPGDPGSLADALRAILNDDERARILGKAGTRTAGMFDWARLIPGLETIYERAVSDASVEPSDQNG
jgi:phosphatidyl-myo-inositol alpha-mannosyltransferase